MCLTQLDFYPTATSYSLASQTHFGVSSAGKTIDHRVRFIYDTTCTVVICREAVRRDDSWPLTLRLTCAEDINAARKCCVRCGREEHCMTAPLAWPRSIRPAFLQLFCMIYQLRDKFLAVNSLYCVQRCYAAFVARTLHTSMHRLLAEKTTLPKMNHINVICRSVPLKYIAPLPYPLDSLACGVSYLAKSCDSAKTDWGRWQCSIMQACLHV